jgi:hypothetical protein
LLIFYPSPGWLWQNSSPPGPFAYNAGAAISAGAYALMESGNALTLDDQAMGGFNGSGNPFTAWGVVFRNNTSQTITSADLTYFGEQWRRATAPDGLSFSLIVSASPITDLAAANPAPAGWTPVPSMGFGAPVVLAGQSRIVLDGNAAANRRQISGTLPITVGIGQYFALRWHDSDGALNTGAALGIDDLLVSFNVGAAVSLPELSSTTLCGATMASWIVVVWARGRRRSSQHTRRQELEAR